MNQTCLLDLKTLHLVLFVSHFGLFSHICHCHLLGVRNELWNIELYSKKCQGRNNYCQN